MAVTLHAFILFAAFLSYSQLTRIDTSKAASQIAIRSDENYLPSKLVLGTVYKHSNGFIIAPISPNETASQSSIIHTDDRPAMDGDCNTRKYA